MLIAPWALSRKDTGDRRTLRGSKGERKKTLHRAQCSKTQLLGGSGQVLSPTEWYDHISRESLWKDLLGLFISC